MFIFKIILNKNYVKNSLFPSLFLIASILTILTGRATNDFIGDSVYTSPVKSACQSNTNKLKKLRMMILQQLLKRRLLVQKKTSISGTLWIVP